LHFLAEKLSIDTGELTDKGVVSQRKHSGGAMQHLIEKLYR